MAWRRDAPQIAGAAGPKDNGSRARRIAGGLARLPDQPCLLISNPTELGNGVGADDLQARSRRRDQRDAAHGWMHGQMNILDVLASHRNGDLTKANGLGHQ